MFVHSNSTKYCQKTIGSGNAVNYCIRDLGPSLLSWILFFLAIVCGGELVLSQRHGYSTETCLAGKLGGLERQT